MARRSFARATRGAAFTGLVALAGCDATNTSIGAWAPEASTGFYLEAESGELSGGFTIGKDTSAFGGGCIEPPLGAASRNEPGAARARYAFDVATPGIYLAWGRIHSPDELHNTFWMQIDGGKWFLWRITTGEVWYWVPLHENFNYDRPLEFDLDVGPHQLVVANAVEGNRLDRFYFTADGDTPPGNDTPCRPPHSVPMNGICIPSCGSQGGNQCSATLCQGQTILMAYDCDVCCKVP
jgi:hypothetical protein